MVVKIKLALGELALWDVSDLPRVVDEAEEEQEAEHLHFIYIYIYSIHWSRGGYLLRGRTPSRAPRPRAWTCPWSIAMKESQWEAERPGRPSAK